MAAKFMVQLWIVVQLSAHPLSYAGEYPSKSIRIVVPYPAGAFNDQLGRTLAQHLSQVWGKPAIVENRPGGNTIIGTDLVAKAPADGHTLLITSFAFATNPSLYGRLPFDTARDFAPVVWAAQTANVVVVHNKLPVKSLGDLIAVAKAKPGSLNYGSAGTGSSTHLAMELLQKMAAMELVRIPYKGSAPMLTDLIGAQVDVTIDNLPNVLPHIKAGKIKPLAVSTARRNAALPEVPTIDESGIRGFELSVWFGIVVPAQTPSTIVDQLNAEANRMLSSPAIKAQFAAQGVEAVGGKPDAFGRFLRTQTQFWEKLIKSSAIQAEQ